MNSPAIGFIGQGYIGKNYADDFEKRGFSVVRYALEEPYVSNKEKIKECDIVFIAVPTPTTPNGFDDHVVREALHVVGVGKIAVIKSTILPGRTVEFQKLHPEKTLFYSPEFLSVTTAAYDAAHPFANIIGMPLVDEKHQKGADLLFSVLPEAPFMHRCGSTEAEIIKYTHNMSAYTQIILFNLMYDFAQAVGADWGAIEKAVKADPYIPSRYGSPVNKGGRGAGGGCFIKDMAAFREHYEKITSDMRGGEVLKAMEKKNKVLLNESKKDIDLLRGVYGEEREAGK